MKFWLSINIKVDKNVKKGATKNEIEVLLSLLDTTPFVGQRDAVAILKSWKQESSSSFNSSIIQ